MALGPSFQKVWSTFLVKRDANDIKSLGTPFPSKAVMKRVLFEAQKLGIDSTGLKAYSRDVIGYDPDIRGPGSRKRAIGPNETRSYTVRGRKEVSADGKSTKEVAYIQIPLNNLGMKAGEVVKLVTDAWKDGFGTLTISPLAEGEVVASGEDDEDEETAAAPPPPPASKKKNGVPAAQAAQA